MDEEKRMNVAVRINETVSVNLQFKKEMSMAEFVATTEIVNKLDKYSYTRKNVVKELQQRPRKKRNGEEFVEEYKKALSPEEKRKLVTKYGFKSYDAMQKSYSYYNRQYRG